MGVHNSTYTGEITPGKALYFRPLKKGLHTSLFIAIGSFHALPFVVNTSDQDFTPQKFLFSRGFGLFFAGPIFFCLGRTKAKEGGFFTPGLVVVRCRKRIRNMPGGRCIWVWFPWIQSPGFLQKPSLATWTGVRVYTRSYCKASKLFF